MREMWILLLPLLPCLLCLVGAAEFEPTVCPGGDALPGVLVTLTEAEFFSAYSGVFRSSDGGEMRMAGPGPGPGTAPPLGGPMAYALALMGAVGAEAIVAPPPQQQQPPLAPGGTSETGAAAAAEGATVVTLRVCGEDFARIALLAVVGNFVSPAPRGPAVAPNSVGGGAGRAGASLPTVVVDVETGRLQVVSSLSSLRAYFLEAMLVVSVLAIARLSMVQTVTVVVRGQQATPGQDHAAAGRGCVVADDAKAGE